MRTIVDLHIHSKYSRACSKDLNPWNIASACAKKGIDLVATGDFTHPEWFKLLKENLEESGNGVFKLNFNGVDALHVTARAGALKTRFILGTELSCIYKHKEKVRRVHHLVLAPSFEAVEKLNAQLVSRGCNIHSDGRPIIGLHSKDLLQVLLEIDPRFELIPAHAWTPWFAIFGSKSGYDSIGECFDEFAPHIHAIETGLSSNPKMNRRLSALDNIFLVSNSDAHSLDKLGREANVFDFERADYDELLGVLRSRGVNKFLYTIEFFPEEGKYHYDGHASCDISFTPTQSKRNKLVCPKCKRPLTLGVLHRIDNLAQNMYPQVSSISNGCSADVPFKSIVPLSEIISNVLEVGVASKKVKKIYQEMIDAFQSEFNILLDVPHEDLVRVCKKLGVPRLAVGVERVRDGHIFVEPGYDGIFGKVSVFKEN